ncbi:MAG: Fic family protein [Lysobacter sp.]|nr:Fic family protein [Lysobacter sp.]
MNCIESLKISELHKNIFSNEAVYAGILRDVEAVVSPCDHKDLNLVPVKVCEIHRRLEEWEHSLQDLLLQEMHISVDEKFERAARLHADFLKIHPFFDGNGLTSRALFGALSQRLLGRILFIPRADQKYISTLRLAIAGDIEPFKAYLLTCASEGN